MAEMKHTPGLLVKDYRGTIGHIKSVGGHPHGHTPTLFRYDNCAISVGEQRDANADRAIACWNACEEAGISDPSAVKELVAAVTALFDADHHDHFAARMSDSELAAIDRMKAVLPRLKG